MLTASYPGHHLRADTMMSWRDFYNQIRLDSGLVRPLGWSYALSKRVAILLIAQ
jgi:hypothetical protein